MLLAAHVLQGCSAKWLLCCQAASMVVGWLLAMEGGITYDAPAVSGQQATSSALTQRSLVACAPCAGRMATVFARLKVPDGKGGLVDHGVHAFIVPLRDEAGRTLPGVEIQDCGYKVGGQGPVALTKDAAAACVSLAGRARSLLSRCICAGNDAILCCCLNPPHRHASHLSYTPPAHKPPHCTPHCLTRPTTHNTPHCLTRPTTHSTPPAQVGLNGVDNGAIRFSHVRVPRPNLLDRFASVDKSGRYSSPLPSEGRRFAATLGELTGGRVGLTFASTGVLKGALTIAIRWGAGVGLLLLLCEALVCIHSGALLP
jgi:hypothetical protein